MATPNEDLAPGDVPTAVGDHATPDEKVQDPEQPNKPILLEVVEYLDKEIAKNNSLDYIDAAAENIMSTQQQVAMRKEIVVNLKNIKKVIQAKLKELK